MTGQPTEPTAVTALVDDVPITYVRPKPGPNRPSLALWLPHLTGVKEDYIPVLRQLADAGYLAISLDLWQHGERSHETPEQIAARVFADFRNHMWPILGHTTLDAKRVIDWAVTDLAQPDVIAGGVSTGGDIAVALAGIDTRTRRVAAIVATPDWTRPGMRELLDPSRVVDQGHAGATARSFYDRLDPITHLDAYTHGPAIAFENGAADTHIPLDGAIRFRDALRTAHPNLSDRVRVTAHPDVEHLDGARNKALLNRGIEWLLHSPHTGDAGA
jgi:dienelactone hydrolase